MVTYNSIDLLALISYFSIVFTIAVTSKRSAGGRRIDKTNREYEKPSQIEKRMLYCSCN